MPLKTVFFEAPKLVSTKTLLLKHYYRRQGHNFMHVPLFPIGEAIKYNYINNFLENYFCWQVTITMTGIIPLRIIYVMISWTMVHSCRLGSPKISGRTSGSKSSVRLSKSGSTRFGQENIVLIFGAHSNKIDQRESSVHQFEGHHFASRSAPLFHGGENS